MLEQLMKPWNLIPFHVNAIKNLLKLRCFLKNINDTGDLDSLASSHTKVNKGQDIVSTADPEVTEDFNIDSIFKSEVLGDRLVIGARARYEGNTENTSEYDTKIDSDVANID